MREIKFRAWQDNKMIYFESIELLWSYEDRYKIKANDLSDNGGYLHDDFIDKWHSNPNLMQYTGLNDKNGKEIYESDLVEDNVGIGFVEFLNGAYRVNYRNGICKWFIDFLDSEKKQLEVVGNIYETK